MPDPTRDNPGVIIFPPLLFGAALLVGLALEWMFPNHPLPRATARAVGSAVLVASVILGGWSRTTMLNAGTNLDPRKPAVAIATAGPFRFTRNPLYLSLTGCYLGIALLVNALWPLALLAPVLVITHFGIVLREERYLEAKFGPAYLAYKARVRRWF